MISNFCSSVKGRLRVHLRSAAAVYRREPPPIPGRSGSDPPRAATNDLKEIVENHIEDLLRFYDEKYRDTYGRIPIEENGEPAPATHI